MNIPYDVNEKASVLNYRAAMRLLCALPFSIRDDAMTSLIRLVHKYDLAPSVEEAPYLQLILYRTYWFFPSRNLSRSAVCTIRGGRFHVPC